MEEMINIEMNSDVMITEVDDLTEISFVESEDLESDPFCYCWTAIESSGDVSNIAFSKVDMFLELTLNKDDGCIALWIERLKKIGKPYIFAKGNLSEKHLNSEKNKKYESFKKAKRKNKIIKKIFTLPKNIAYGLFSNTDH